MGFVPDFGATWLLSRAPGGTGIRLGLTAEHVGPADAIHVGFSDHFVPSDRIPQLLSALESEDAPAAIALLAETPEASALAEDAEHLDAAFQHDSVTGIIDALRARGADAVADGILSKSPTALTVTLESLRRASALPSLEKALEEEFIVSMNALQHPDFAEGVRAQLIDKDRNPRWSPATLDDVDPAQVDAFFTPGAAGELDLDDLALSKETK